MAAALELHCHSTCSDGRLSPGDLVAQAAEAGLELLALTDHDTLAGFAAARAAGAAAGIAVAPAVEISTRWKKATLHLLAYFPVGWSAATVDGFESWLDALANRRRDRNRRLSASLRAHGIGFPEAIEETQPWGRPHFAQWLVTHGYAGNVEEAFGRYLVRGAPTYVSMNGVPTDEAIGRVKAAGGRAALAHPGRMTMAVAPVVEALAAAGLDAIEVYYPAHTPDHVSYFLELARRHGLQASGGSDFHGRAGERLGQIELPVAVAAFWRDALCKAPPARG